MSDRNGSAGNDASPLEEVAAGLRRRALLAAVAGRFALAASGLFLPFAEDAAAGEDVNGETRRGKHRKRHRTKERRRSGGFRDSALTVANASEAILLCTYCVRTKLGLDDYALPDYVLEKSLDPGTSFRFDPEQFRVGVLIRQVDPGTDLYADVRNVSYWYPRGGVTTGSNLEPHNDVFGNAFIAEQNYAEREQRKRAKIILKRKDDSPGRIEWELMVGQGRM